MICKRCNLRVAIAGQTICQGCTDELVGIAMDIVEKKIEAPAGRTPTGQAEFELLNARKLKAFDWLAANADELSIEWTGTHNHIYSGNEENLERLGCGRSLLEAIENCLGI